MQRVIKMRLIRTPTVTSRACKGCGKHISGRMFKCDICGDITCQQCGSVYELNDDLEENGQGYKNSIIGGYIKNHEWFFDRGSPNALFQELVSVANEEREAITQSELFELVTQCGTSVLQSMFPLRYLSQLSQFLPRFATSPSWRDTVTNFHGLLFNKDFAKILLGCNISCIKCYHAKNPECYVTPEDLCNEFQSRFPDQFKEVLGDRSFTDTFGN